MRQNIKITKKKSENVRRNRLQYNQFVTYNSIKSACLLLEKSFWEQFVITSAAIRGCVRYSCQVFLHVDAKRCLEYVNR